MTYFDGSGPRSAAAERGISPQGKASNAPDALLQACIQCGLCLPHCATYLASGSEVQSPRGRLLLLGEVLAGTYEGDDQAALDAFDLCLGCRACETVCPSGVSYQLWAHAKDLAADRLRRRPPLPRRWLSSRVALVRLRRLARLGQALLDHFPGADWRRRTEKGPAWLRRWGRRFAVLPAAPESDAELVHLLDDLCGRPHLPAKPMVAEDAPSAPPAVRARKAPTVAFFQGCANAALLGESSRRLRAVLTAAGCRIVVPEDQACCGALARHTQAMTRAMRARKRNLEAFGRTSEPWEYLVVEAAGCGLELSDYPPEISARVTDASRLLAMLPLPRARSVPLQVVLHDPCHARHGQGIVNEPRKLLQHIPELTLQEPAEPEVCCGSGGAYSLVHPDLSAAMGRRKAQHLAETGADLVVTANPGCLGQIAGALALVKPDLPVIPLTDLLWYAVCSR